MSPLIVATEFGATATGDSPATQIATQTHPTWQLPAISCHPSPSRAAAASHLLPPVLSTLTSYTHKPTKPLTRHALCPLPFSPLSQTTHCRLRQLPTSTSSPMARIYSHSLTASSTRNTRPSSNSHAPHCALLLRAWNRPIQQNPPLPTEPNNLEDRSHTSTHT